MSYHATLADRRHDLARRLSEALEPILARDAVISSPRVCELCLTLRDLLHLNRVALASADLARLAQLWPTLADRDPSLLRAMRKDLPPRLLALVESGAGPEDFDLALSCDGAALLGGSQ